MGNSILHKARRPSEIRKSIGMCILQIYMIFFFVQDEFIPLNLLVSIMITLAAGAIIGIIIYRLFMFSTAFPLELMPEVLKIKNTALEARRINKIYINGYFKPVIAIQPRGRLTVPYTCCFCFADKEDQGIKDLEEWAGQHQIKVLHKSFIRWL